MEIRKMRGNEINIGEIPFIIVPEDAVAVIRPESTTNMPSGTIPESMIRLKFKCCGYEIPFAKGSQNLFIVHPSIDPLVISTSLGTDIIARGKHKVFYRSYLHGEKTIIDRFNECSKNLLDESTIKDIEKLISFLSINPTKYSIDELYYMTERYETSINPDIVVVEGLEVLQDLSDPLEFLNSQYNSLIRKSVNRITGFYFMKGFKEECKSIPLINLYDNVINVGPYVDKEERFVKIEPFRLLLKAAPLFTILIRADYIENCTNL
jgi:circadian clock protein KaiC